jgi:hypothetical protein
VSFAQIAARLGGAVHDPASGAVAHARNTATNQDTIVREQFFDVPAQ